MFGETRSLKSTASKKGCCWKSSVSALLKFAIAESDLSLSKLVEANGMLGAAKGEGRFEGGGLACAVPVNGLVD